MASQTVFTGAIVPPGKGGTQIIATDCFAIVISTLFVALRFYARRMRKISTQPEDCMVVVALVSYYGMVISSFLLVFVGGFGHHYAQLQPYHITRLLKLSFASQVTYAVCLCLIKCSICVMLRRIFFIRIFRILAFLTMVLCCSWGIMTILVGLLICKPVRMNWDPTTPGGHCGNQNRGFALVGVMDLVTDSIILVLPIPMVLRLHLQLANRIGLCSIFGVGILTMIAGGLRMAAIFSLDFTDFPSSARVTHIWAIVEPCVAMMAASSPTLRPIFDKVLLAIQSTIQTTHAWMQSRDGSHNHTATADATATATTAISRSNRTFLQKQSNTAVTDEDEELALKQFSSQPGSVKTTTTGIHGPDDSRSGSTDMDTQKPIIHVRMTVTQEVYAR